MLQFSKIRPPCLLEILSHAQSKSRKVGKRFICVLRVKKSILSSKNFPIQQNIGRTPEKVSPSFLRFPATLRLLLSFPSNLWLFKTWWELWARIRKERRRRKTLTATKKMKEWKLWENPIPIMKKPGVFFIRSERLLPQWKCLTYRTIATSTKNCAVIVDIFDLSSICSVSVSQNKARPRLDVTTAAIAKGGCWKLERIQQYN